jgi:anti-sigma factor RsiW
MNCETLRWHLLDFVDGALDETRAAACRDHAATCSACAREIALHRATAQLLDELPRLDAAAADATPPLRLRQMAAGALAKARAEPEEVASGGGSPGKIVALPRATTLRRRLVRVAAAAVVLLSAALGTQLLLKSRVDPTAGDEPPSFVSDPEFVGNFEVLRDMPVADSSDGELLDLDHDDVAMLQLLEDV